MSTRVERSLLLAVLAVGAAGCHKAPPATAPAPVRSSPPSASGPGPRESAPPPAPPPASDNGAEAAARLRAAEARLAEMVHFDYNEAVLRPADKMVLDAKAALLKEHTGVRIRITGHCDERGSDEYNIALGMRRAIAAKEYLAAQGIDSSRVDVASLGREMPLDRGNTEEAWAKNRRDEFVLVSGTLR